MNSIPEPRENTDTKLWEQDGGASIHVTKHGSIGIQVRGHVIVMPVEKWHALGRLRCILDEINK